MTETKELKVKKVRLHLTDDTVRAQAMETVRKQCRQFQYSKKRVEEVLHVHGDQAANLILLCEIEDAKQSETPKAKQTR